MTIRSTNRFSKLPFWSTALPFSVTLFRLIAVLGIAAAVSACDVPAGPTERPKAGTNEGSETLRLAQATAESGDHETAARLFEKELAETPDSVAALKGLGDSYSRLGQQNRAESALLRAKELAPRDDEIHALLGRIYLSQSRPDEALENYETALRLSPQNISAITGKGVAFDTMSRHADAQKAYQTGLSYYPTNYVLRSNYALSLALSGNEAQSVSILQELVRDPAAAPYVRDNLALVYGLFGRENDARATLALDMNAQQIEENILVYRALRRSMNEGNPIGELVFS